MQINALQNSVWYIKSTVEIVIVDLLAEKKKLEVKLKLIKIKCKKKY